MVETLQKTDVSVKEKLRESFPYKLLLLRDLLLEKKESGGVLGYLPCDINAQENLWEQIACIPPVCKITNVCRQDIGPLIQEYAENEGPMTQPRRELISSFELTSGTTLTPWFFVLLGAGSPICKR